MRSAVLVLACLGIIALLAGCGSGSSTFTLACATHRLPSGFIVTKVAVTNTTSSARDATLFGSVLTLIRHISPVLKPDDVIATADPGGKSSYIGFLVPGVSPKKPSRLSLTFVAPSRSRKLYVTDKRTFSTSDSAFSDSPSCTIHVKK